MCKYPLGSIYSVICRRPQHLPVQVFPKSILLFEVYIESEKSSNVNNGLLEGSSSSKTSDGDEVCPCLSVTFPFLKDSTIVLILSFKSASDPQLGDSPLIIDPLELTLVIPLECILYEEILSGIDPPLDNFGSNNPFFVDNRFNLLILDDHLLDSDIGIELMEIFLGEIQGLIKKSPFF